MTHTLKEQGNRFGTHRVIKPKGALPQPALKIDNDMDRIWGNEILVDVDTLNVDSASFNRISRQAGGDVEKIKEIIFGIVAERGKLQNPTTGSGGMFIGTVSKIGVNRKPLDLKPGDRIASLVSLSLTPLRIDEIREVREEIDQVVIKGKAILFESGIYIRMPDDLPPTLALAALDVCGAPPQIAQLVQPGDTVVVLGATGKSGILCSYTARKSMSGSGSIIGLGHSENKCRTLESLGLCDLVVKVDASDALECYEEISRLTNGRMADLVINCANIPDAEMTSILMCGDGGTIYFFNMATSFTRAALSAEGVGKDVRMIIGNGYTKGHAEFTLNILRESKVIRELFESRYC